MPLPSPPLTLQKRIANILRTIDAAIQHTELQIAKLEKIKSGMMHDLFTRGVSTDGKLRPKHEKAPDSFKQSTFGPIPKTWDVVQLGDLAQFITSGSRGWANYYSETGPLFLRIGNLTREHINFRLDNVVRLSLPNEVEGQRTAVSAGDILISIKADLGIVAVVPAGFEEAYVSQHIALARLKESGAISRFIGHFLGASIAQRQFKKLDDTGAKSGLNLPAIAKLSIVLPRDPQESQYIAEKIDTIDLSIAVSKAERLKLESLKSGLMRDLLTGRVPVPEGIAA